MCYFRKTDMASERNQPRMDREKDLPWLKFACPSPKKQTDKYNLT